MASLNNNWYQFKNKDNLYLKLKNIPVNNQSKKSVDYEYVQNSTDASSFHVYKQIPSEQILTVLFNGKESVIFQHGGVILISEEIIAWGDGLSKDVHLESMGKNNTITPVPSCAGIDCSNNGTCTIGGCVCDDKFAPPDCSKCAPGHFGPKCESKKECDNGGIYGPNNTCYCVPGWMGDYCEEKALNKYIPCLNGCMGNGVCDYNTGMCNCKKGYEGPDCGVKSKSNTIIWVLLTVIVCVIIGSIIYRRKKCK